MGDKHDNSEYQNPVSRTGVQPPPPETFVNYEPDAGQDSDAAFREDIRSGMSQDEAEQRAQQRAEDAEAPVEEPAVEEEPVEEEPVEEPVEEEPEVEEPVEEAPEVEEPVEAPEVEAPVEEAEPELTGDALKARAAELEIEGRSTMSAPELRAAIAKAESAG